MKRFGASFACLVLVVAGSVSGADADPKADELQDHLTRREVLRARGAAERSGDSLIVRFDDDASRVEVGEAVVEADAEVTDSLPELGRVKVLEVEEGTDVADAAQELLDDPAVAIVEYDRPRVPLGTYPPNDEQFLKQWYLHNRAQLHPIADPFGNTKEIRGKREADIDALQAWDVEDGSSTQPVIAVLDIGVDPLHPDIASNRWTNPNEIANNDVDDDGNGFVDDTRGWDFTGQGDPNPSDTGNRQDRGHGTHVAAIAAGVTNNNEGVAGVCPECKILHLRFGLTLAQELKAIHYIIDTMEANPGLQIPVLNTSFGSEVWSQIERDAFEELGDKGVLVVAAAGNAGLDNDMFDAVDYQGDGIPDDFSPLYPASYELPGILAVAASNSHDRLAFSTGCVRRGLPRWQCRFTNWGRTSVDVAAPGTDIRSAYLRTGPSSDYRTWNGTSMAAPVVAGIAGLVMSKHPNYSVMQLKNAIMRSVDRPDSLKKLWHRPGPASKGSFIRTNGRVNALSALTTPTGNAYPVHDGMMAGAIEIKQVGLRGKVSWPGDVNDVFYKVLTKGERYAAILRGDHRSRNIDLVVYKPGTKDVWQLEDACMDKPGAGGCHVIQPFTGLSGDGTERVEFTATRNGPHYFLVSSYFVDDAYRVEVRRAQK